MKFPIPEELHVLVLLADEMREGLERFGIRRPTILNAASIIISILYLFHGRKACSMWQMYGFCTAPVIVMTSNLQGKSII